jgi:F-type H+-transporting ATPase subunit delta
MNATSGPDPQLDGTTDVGAQRIAHVYAEALYKAAAAKGQIADVLEECHSLIQDVFQAHPQLEVLVAGSAIGRTVKEEVLKKAFQGRCSELFFNFLLVLNNHDRLGLLRPILTALRQIDDARNRRIRVQVWTAVPLPDDQRDHLAAQLGQRLQGQLTLDLRVDPDLLGGLVVRTGDYVYDQSVRTQLRYMCKELIERSSHEIQSRRDSFSSAV